MGYFSTSLLTKSQLIWAAEQPVLNLQQVQGFYPTC